jgi:hypothetical protein
LRTLSVFAVKTVWTSGHPNVNQRHSSLILVTGRFTLHMGAGECADFAAKIN